MHVTVPALHFLSKVESAERWKSSSISRGSLLVRTDLVLGEEYASNPAAPGADPGADDVVLLLLR